MTFYARTGVDPSPFLANIPKVVAKLDPNLPVENLRTLEQQVQNNVFMDRLMTTLSAAFAVLATLLAAVGLYGVLANRGAADARSASAWRWAPPRTCA
jgi:hypothetical protein